ncbi:unnamed protein product [Nippostrongylus brasiliensis]|uniref:Transposase n=1 Tax=Nippostrongylus brasiliensis TaxID=27835 RepID=A0A0N4Y0T5_NIPBR|nr:unnamed protein product [Nippostrongylus brasiliensis]
MQARVADDAPTRLDLMRIGKIPDERVESTRNVRRDVGIIGAVLRRNYRPVIDLHQKFMDEESPVVIRKPSTTPPPSAAASRQDG